MKQKIKRWIIYFILMAIFFVLFYLILEKIYWIFINEKVTTEKNNDDLLILKILFKVSCHSFLQMLLIYLDYALTQKKKMIKIFLIFI